MNPRDAMNPPADSTALMRAYRDNPTDENRGRLRRTLLQECLVEMGLAEPSEQADREAQGQSLEATSQACEGGYVASGPELRQDSQGLVQSAFCSPPAEPTTCYYCQSHAQEAQTPGALDSAGRVREDASRDNAGPEEGDGGNEEKAEDQAQDAHAQDTLAFWFAPVPRSRLRRTIEDIVQRVKAANLIYWMTWRPPLRWPSRPNETQNIEAWVAGNDAVPHITLHRVSKDLESHAADSEGRTEEDGSLSAFPLEFSRGFGTRRGEKRDSLRARLRKRLAPRTYIVGYRPPSDPDSVPLGRLFDRVEAFVLRIWDDFMGRINLLKHECGLDRPRRK